MRTLIYPLIPNRKPHLLAYTVFKLEEGKECIPGNGNHGSGYGMETKAGKP